MVAKLVKESMKTHSEEDGENSFVQQLEVVSRLLSRLADVQKAARKASKSTKSNYLSGYDGETNQVSGSLDLARRTVGHMDRWTSG